jgi:hypothetical protein
MTEAPDGFVNEKRISLTARIWTLTRLVFILDLTPFRAHLRIRIRSHRAGRRGLVTVAMHVLLKKGSPFGTLTKQQPRSGRKELAVSAAAFATTLFGSNGLDKTAIISTS